MIKLGGWLPVNLLFPAQVSLLSSQVPVPKVQPLTIDDFYPEVGAVVMIPSTTPPYIITVILDSFFHIDQIIRGLSESRIHVYADIFFNQAYRFMEKLSKLIEIPSIVLTENMACAIEGTLHMLVDILNLFIRHVLWTFGPRFSNNPIDSSSIFIMP